MSLASQLWKARQNHSTVAGADITPPKDEAQAYEWQKEYCGLTGLSQIGWKIGATSEVVKQAMHVTQPIIGPIFDGHLVHSGDEFPVVASQWPHLETEFTFVLGADMPPRSEPYTNADVVVASVHRSFEIVGRRFTDVAAVDAGLVGIVDGGMNVGMVLGGEISGWSDDVLFQQEVSVDFDGKAAGSGSGKAQLWPDGVTELAWLANQRVIAPRGLKAGDLVMTGTVAGVIAFEPGITATADYGSLGGVEVRLINA